jgi:hypothetical protein
MQNQEDNAHRNLLSNIKSETSLIQDKINTTQRSIIAQQLTMCQTLTQFYNLRPTPPSVSDTSSYSLFNFLIPNLMTYLHTFSHEELITSLETFCRFLVQVSTYLNILLPNTIHLPTEGRSIIVLERFQNPGIIRLLRRSLLLRELIENHPKAMYRSAMTTIAWHKNHRDVCSIAWVHTRRVSYSAFRIWLPSARLFSKFFSLFGRCFTEKKHKLLHAYLNLTSCLVCFMQSLMCSMPWTKVYPMKHSMPSIDCINTKNNINCKKVIQNSDRNAPNLER